MWYDKLMENIERLKFNKESLDLLYEILPKIKNSQVARELLKDLMSSSEVKDLARRLLSAKRLYKGYTYSDINYESGMSSATINKMHFKTKGSRVLQKLLSK